MQCWQPIAMVKNHGKCIASNTACPLGIQEPGCQETRSRGVATKSVHDLPPKYGQNFETAWIALQEDAIGERIGCAERNWNVMFAKGNGDEGIAFCHNTASQQNDICRNRSRRQPLCILFDIHRTTLHNFVRCSLLNPNDDDSIGLLHMTSQRLAMYPHMQSERKCDKRDGLNFTIDSRVAYLVSCPWS